MPTRFRRAIARQNRCVKTKMRTSKPTGTPSNHASPYLNMETSECGGAGVMHARAERIT
jgi:hypothetical protein